MKVLSIGNSFSQDAQRYLHEIAKADGIDIYSVNLYIGGCSLETHYNNLKEDSVSYSLQINGIETGELISIKTALLSDKWDYVTLQQVSGKSGNYSTYNPYIKEIFACVKELCPNAKILVHQTWAYEDKSDVLFLTTPYKTAEEMHENILKAYNQCLIDLPFNGIIPCGIAMMNAIKLGIGKIYRDGFHASFGAGRYLLGLTFYKYLTGRDIDNNDFSIFDEMVTDSQRKIVIKSVNDALN